MQTVTQFVILTEAPRERRTVEGSAFALAAFMIEGTQ